jgi:hypothetical protein
MPESRVTVIGEEAFNPREWLRREVLWASLMGTYTEQMDSWLNGTRKAIQDGHVSRKELYEAQDDPEMQARAFFNQGKVVAGYLTSAALFRAARTPEGVDPVNVLEVQASSVDKVVERLHSEPSAAERTGSEEAAFMRCAELAIRANEFEPGHFIREHNFMRAAAIMTIMASTELRPWIAASWQNEDGSLPHLTIENGGFPRSTGGRTEARQPIFHKITASEAYQALAD